MSYGYYHYPQGVQQQQPTYQSYYGLQQEMQVRAVESVQPLYARADKFRSNSTKQYAKGSLLWTNGSKKS